MFATASIRELQRRYPNFRSSDGVRAEKQGLTSIGCTTSRLPELRLRLVRAHHAADAELSSIGGREHHVGSLHLRQLLQDGTRAVAEIGLALPELEGLPEGVGGA